jgi:hypothetical protein
MDAIVAWTSLCEVIEHHYHNAGNGRPPPHHICTLPCAAASLQGAWPGRRYTTFMTGIYSFKDSTVYLAVGAYHAHPSSNIP